MQLEGWFPAFAGMTTIAAMTNNSGNDSRQYIVELKMKTSDFNFDLPEELIARYPLKNRADSRLLLLQPAAALRHQVFSDLPALLNENDLLIFNNTRVIPARLEANKATGGKVEILIERILPDNFALAHVKANKSLKLPVTVYLNNKIEVVISERQEDLYILQFLSSRSIRSILDDIGLIPLPPYMQRAAEGADAERYQTVYSSKEGAVAAPTAGLHFDQHLLQNLSERGVAVSYITLHVGAGTFKPVCVEDFTQHKMHSEIFEVTNDVCEKMAQTRKKGGRVIAVGTTTVRALETVLQSKGEIVPCSGETNIFIYPGYRFRSIDALITNFHLPKSTLLMLVCALGGYEDVMRSYEVAVAQQYRFFSYGDAMFVENHSNEI